jgi:hypothetical protein
METLLLLALLCGGVQFAGDAFFIIHSLQRKIYF